MKRSTSPTSPHPLKSPSPYFSTFSEQQYTSSPHLSPSSSYYSDSHLPTASTSSLVHITEPKNGGSTMLRRRGEDSTYSASNSDVDSDITRPSLRRVTNNSSRKKAESEGKARRSFDEVSRNLLDGQQDREVVIHQLVKTDSIASISLSYGITPQALRLSNRLWPSDSIHLRKTLNIPLDQCHLPSSSGIERVSREEDGNLVLWERERATPPPLVSHGSYGTSGSRGDLNPLAAASRRAASASALDLGAGSRMESFGGNTLDLFTGRFEDSNHRSSLDSFRAQQDKGKAPALLIDGEGFNFDDAVSGYLPSTNNPYSSASSSAPASPPSNGMREIPATVDHFSRLNTPPLPRVFTNNLPSDPSESPYSSVPPSPTTYSDSTTSFPSPGSLPLSSSNLNVGSLSRRTLQVTKVPSSSLSFFPPPNPSFSSTTSSTANSTARSSFCDDEPNLLLMASLSPPPVPASTRINETGKGSGAVQVRKSKDGKRIENRNTNARVNVNSSAVDTLGLGKALGLLHLASGSSTTNKSGEGEAGKKKHWTERWNLSYFGEEEAGGAEGTMGNGGGNGVKAKEEDLELDWEAGGEWNGNGSAYKSRSGTIRGKSAGGGKRA